MLVDTAKCKRRMRGRRSPFSPKTRPTSASLQFLPLPHAVHTATMAPSDVVPFEGR